MIIIAWVIGLVVAFSWGYYSGMESGKRGKHITQVQKTNGDNSEQTQIANLSKNNESTIMTSKTKSTHLE